MARAAGVGVETVRYYQRRGLLPRPERPQHAYRRYDEDVLSRLRFIRRAQELGFTLREIAELLSLDVHDCARSHEIAERRLEDIRAKVRDLRAVANRLSRMLTECRAGHHEACPIITAIGQVDPPFDTKPGASRR
ncbi:MerR family transcriptional regulator [Sulfurifustis variabilis]|nr:MerR family transcriptional regulator [Sulfurifustis variabilis]